MLSLLSNNDVLQNRFEDMYVYDCVCELPLIRKNLEIKPNVFDKCTEQCRILFFVAKSTNNRRCYVTVTTNNFLPRKTEHRITYLKL